MKKIKCRTLDLGLYVKYAYFFRIKVFHSSGNFIRNIPMAIIIPHAWNPADNLANYVIKSLPAALITN